MYVCNHVHAYIHSRHNVHNGLKNLLEVQVNATCSFIDPLGTKAMSEDVFFRQSRTQATWYPRAYTASIHCSNSAPDVFVGSLPTTHPASNLTGPTQNVQTGAPTTPIWAMADITGKRNNLTHIIYTHQTQIHTLALLPLLPWHMSSFLLQDGCNPKHRIAERLHVRGLLDSKSPFGRNSEQLLMARVLEAKFGLSWLASQRAVVPPACNPYKATQQQYVIRYDTPMCCYVAI